MKKYLIESLGTCLLVMFGCGAGLVGFDYFNILGVAATFALFFCFWNFIAGKFSACHLNPVVSLAAFILNKLSIKEFFGYALWQFIGAIVGSFILLFYISLSSDATKLLTSCSYWVACFAEYSSYNTSIIAAVIIEIVLTFVLVLTFIIMYYKYNKSKYAGLIIAGVYFIVIICGFNFTGACVNPARGLGPALIYLIMGSPLVILQFIPIFISNIVGSLFAVLAFRFLFKEECKDTKISALNYNA